MKKPIDANVSPRGVLKRLRAANPGLEFKTKQIGATPTAIQFRKEGTRRWHYLGVWTNEPRLYTRLQDRKERGLL
jgi:hypothetical protein